MRIGIDCRTLVASAGIGEYGRQLVKNLLIQDKHNHYVLFLNEDEKLPPEIVAGDYEIKRFPLSRYRRYLPFFYSQLIVGKLINRQKLDVCLFPANIIPLGYRGQAVVTIHDLAVYLYPELFLDRLINFDRRYLVPQSLKQADKIIAVSNSTKRDIIKLFGIAPEKIEVIYEGVADREATYQKGKEKYILYLGTIEPRKNLTRLIGAFKKLKQEEPVARDLKLILAGKNGWKNEEIFRGLRQANAELQEEAIKYLGYVTPERKHELLSHAEVFVFPSLYEGFGLPVAEAMACGLPVITSDAGSLPEIGGEAVLYVNPLKEEEICLAIKKVITVENFRQQLAEKGKQKSREFTWDKCAQQTKELLEGLQQVKR
ncbi:MAG: glycosyltransferase family 1 protein [Patescibacteria group bacterium]|jgi:glycosyltransferase involved in cell wall biosynthesis